MSTANIFVVYAVVWLLIFAYMFSVSHRQRGLQQQLDALREKLWKRET